MRGRMLATSIGVYAVLCASLSACSRPVEPPITAPHQVPVPEPGVTVHILGTPHHQPPHHQPTDHAMAPISSGLAYFDHRVPVPTPAAGAERVLEADDFAIADPADLQVLVVGADGRGVPVSPVVVRSPAIPRIGDKVIVSLRHTDETRVGHLVAVESEDLVLETRSTNVTYDVNEGRASLDADIERKRVARADVIRMRAPDVSARARFELPAGAPDAGLIRLRYRSDTIAWRPSYQIAMHDQDAVRVRAAYRVENRGARPLRDVRVHLYRGRDNAPLHTAVHTLPATSEVVVAHSPEWTLSSCDVQAAVWMTDPAMREERSRELPVDILSEYVCPIPASHPLQRLGPGPLSVMSARGHAFDPDHYPYNAYAEPLSGTWRMDLGATTPIRARARATWYREPEGRYMRYRVDLDNPGVASERVAVWLDIPRPGLVEVLEFEPEPLRRQDGRAYLEVMLEPGSETYLTYLAFFPGRP